MYKLIYPLLLLLTAPFISFGQTKDIFHLDTLLEVKIYFEDENWRHILDSLKEDGEKDRLDGIAYVDGELYADVEVRYKGNSSYNSVEKRGEIKLPLNIKFDKDHKLPGGYNRLKLANGFRDPSFVREVISYEIARKYLPAPRANFAKVYINDEYLGLYTSAEDVDNTFLERHYGYHKGIMFKCDPEWQTERPDHCPEGDKASLMYLGNDSLCYQGLYELKTDFGWSELIKLTKYLDEENLKLEEVLDVDQALWMLAFDNVLVNLDSYVGAFSHNYYLYQDTFGVFHPIVWDMNLSLGGFTIKNEKEIFEKEELQKYSLFANFNNEKRPLASKLLKNDLYRKMYVAHAKTILEENFTNGFYERRLDTLKAFVDTLVKKDTNKLYSYEDFLLNFDTTVMANKTAIIGLRELMDKRVAYLADHPLMQREGPQVADVKHQTNEESVEVEVQVKGAGQVWLCYRAERFGNFRRTQMGRGEMVDSESGDLQKWVFELPAAEIRDYYIIAENDKAVSLSPRRASKEFHTLAEE